MNIGVTWEMRQRIADLWVKKSSATQSLDAVRESTIKETEEVTLRRFPDDLLEILRGVQPTLNIRNPVPL